MEQLSSSMTFFYKFIFTSLWIGVFGLANLFTFTSSIQEDESAMADRFNILIIWIVGSSLLYLGLVRLKKVQLKCNELIVSNFRTEIRIPLSEIDKATGSKLVSPELVWIHLKNPTPFGSKIQFMATLRFPGGFSRHPVVDRINLLLAQGERS